MSHIIALAQRKSGVGKTTLAVSTAAEIRRCGGNVALVDTDPQRSASDWAEPGNLGFPVHGLTIGDASVSTWAEAVMRFDVDYLVIDTAPNDQALARPQDRTSKQLNDPLRSSKRCGCGVATRFRSRSSPIE